MNLKDIKMSYLWSETTLNFLIAITFFSCKNNLIPDDVTFVGVCTNQTHFINI